jgi:hypothetical protein
MNGNKKTPKNAVFSCSDCDFTCCKKSEWVRHTNTIKHTYGINGNKMEINLAPKNAKQVCKVCNKEYISISGLWKHNQKCKLNESETKLVLQEEQTNKYVKDVKDVKDEKDELKQKTEELIQYLMKENAEFKQLIMDQNKQMFELAKNSGNHNNNTNNNFNLQFFLNETCKDALNIMDFVNQLQISIKDLEDTGRLGFVEGISKIFINGLNSLNLNNRPVHCSDSKREVLYIKDNDQWNKETEDKIILTNALKHVVSKNMRLIPEWKNQNPKCNDYDSKENDRYLKIVSEAMPGSTKEESTNNYCKIVRNIVKETVIPKNGGVALV